MLIAYHNRRLLPRNDLVYAAFLLSLQETAHCIESGLEVDEEEDKPDGFLVQIPFLQPIPLQVQVDLLAETWTRHCSDDSIDASLLDAAIVYAAYMTAARMLHDAPAVAATWLESGPRKVDPRVLHESPEPWEDLFDQWWDDRDFLMVNEFPDMPPEKAQYVRWLLRLPEEMIRTMFDALERGRPSPQVGERLDGLLSIDQIGHVVSLLTPSHG